MKTYKKILAIMLLALVASQASAQDSETKSYKKVRIGLGLEGALPSGGLKTMYNYGGGASFRVAVAFSEKSAVTATTGAIAFIPKDLAGGVDMKAQINIPIKAGYKYMLSNKVYALGEAGTSIVKSYAVDGAGNVYSANGSAFTYAASIGAHALGLDTSLRYEGYSGAGFLGLRLGFNF